MAGKKRSHNGKAGSNAAPKPRRSRRRRRRNATKVVVAPAEPNNCPGNIAVEVERIPRRKGKGGTRNLLGREAIAASHELPDYAYEWVHRHLNPCGEMVTHKSSSKVPDGALDNSAEVGLREVLIVRAPTLSTSTVTLDGSMWTLTLIHTSMLRTPLIMVASLVNAEMTEGDRQNLINAWNSTPVVPVYPNWAELGSDTIYWTTTKWTALAEYETPDTGRDPIEQFRISADGITVFHNTPDLVNQGMVIGAQYNSNVAVTTRSAAPDAEGQVITLQINSSGAITTMPLHTFNVPISDITITTQTNVINVTVDRTDTYPYLRWYTQNGAQNTGYVLAVTGELSANVSFATTVGGELVRYRRGAAMTVSVAWTPTAQGSGTGTMVVNVTAVAEGETEPTTWLDRTNTGVTYNAGGVKGAYEGMRMLEESGAVKDTEYWQLPPTTTEGIIQSTPKAVYMSMKEQNGVYMVKRVWEPVFNMQDGQNYHNIIMHQGDQEDAWVTFAPKDSWDLNFGVGVIIMTCLPYAAAPALKLIRDLEVVARDGSMISTFMSTCEDASPGALTIAHSMSKHHPFMYPESYNILGGLVNMISGVLKKVPIIGDVVGTVGHVIKNLTSAESGMTSNTGSSQNRLGSFNIDELMPTLQKILGSLNLGTTR